MEPWSLWDGGVTVELAFSTLIAAGLVPEVLL